VGVGCASKTLSIVDSARAPMYSAKCFQSFIQSLANEVICDARERLAKIKFSCEMECYDELTGVEPRSRVTHERIQHIHDVAVAKPTWWVGCPPLETQVQVANNYGGMK